MRVLDLFCGRGGWSKAFVEHGHDVLGIDNQDFSKIYPGKFLQANVEEIKGNDFEPFDLIIGSPPCAEFSIMTELRVVVHKKPRDIAKGIELIKHFERIVEENKPKLWAMENVTRMELYYPKVLGQKPIWKFRISKRGWRYLWANFTFGRLVGDFSFKRNMEHDFVKYPYEMRSSFRAEIPKLIADFVCKVIEEKI